MKIITTMEELLNSTLFKSVNSANEQSTATGPQASKEFKETAIAAIDKYLEHSRHVDTMETVVTFLGDYEKNQFDNMHDALHFIDDLITYFLLPENCTGFSAKYSVSNGYTLSEMLPALRDFFTDLMNDTSRATIRRDWLVRFSGGAEEKTVAAIVQMYTDKNTQYEATHRAA